MNLNNINTEHNNLNANDTKSLSELLFIGSDNYTDTDVSSLPLSIRIINCFRNEHINTVADLLALSPAQLMQIKGVGAKCINDLGLYFSNITAKSFPQSKQSNTNKLTIPQIVIDNKEKIILGDFSFLNSVAEESLLQSYKDAFSFIDEELILECYCNPQKVSPIISCLSEFSYENQKENERILELNELVDTYPFYRKSNSVIGYINAYTNDGNKRNALMLMDSSKMYSFYSMITCASKLKQQEYVEVRKFLNWASFNPAEEIAELFDVVFKKENMRIVVQMRTSHHTLEQIGQILGVTRERVRQIEAKAKRIFAQWQRNHRMILKISAERNGDTILTPQEIEEYCNEYTDEFLFFLKTFQGSTYTYDPQLDVFIVGNDTLPARMQDYLENLPDIFNASKLAEIIDNAYEIEDIPKEILEKAINNSYKLTGDTYHRCRLSLQKMYSYVLNMYYKQGIHAYDEAELITFRKRVKETYGDVTLPENDRAITARIANLCILSGKGIYRPKSEKYISNNLLEKIHQYILNSDNSIFLTNTLFYEFEEELISEGVDNKYFLQGILHESFANEFVFHRDYVSKDGSFTSIYAEIIRFIKKYDYPVKKSEIHKAFPGVTEIVISFATSDPSVLNFFGEYLHESKLKINSPDIHYLRNVIDRTIEDNNPHHCSEIFEIIQSENAVVLSRNAASSSFSTYSILECLFRDQYQFSRPYIAKREVKIGRPGERLHDLIYESDEFQISDIRDFQKESHFQIQCLLDYLNQCNDAYLIADENELVSISCSNITEETSKQIEQIVLDEVDATVPISSLQCISKFPQLCIPWTDWLIYSILNKWSNALEVSASTNQFRYAVPLISRKGKMKASDYSDLTRGSNKPIVMADDLDNIDDLIANIIIEEISEV